MRKWKQLWHKLFSRRLKGFAWVSYSRAIEGEKKGADIWGTDFPIPVSDVLHFKLLEEEDGSQYIITSITSKILFIIPFTYDEYIIEIPWHKYELNQFDANKALIEINAAEHWNQNHEMEPSGFEGDVIFSNGSYSFSLKVDSGSNYIWLERNGN